jgi:hypothetical protein
MPRFGRRRAISSALIMALTLFAFVAAADPAFGLGF